jgi:hypothetical protein
MCGQQVVNGSQGVCPAGSTCSMSGSIFGGLDSQTVNLCSDSQGAGPVGKTLTYIVVAVVVVVIAICMFFARCGFAALGHCHGVATLSCCCDNLVCCGRRKEKPLLDVHVVSDSRDKYLPPPMYALQPQPAPQQMQAIPHMPAAIMTGMQPQGFAPQNWQQQQNQFGYSPQPVDMHFQQQQQQQMAYPTHQM